MVNYKLCDKCKRMGFSLKFYIFKGARHQNKYIEPYKSRTCITMQKKAWTTSFLFKKFMWDYKLLTIWNQHPNEFFNPQTFICYIWPWFTCYLKCNKMCIGFWFKHDHLTFSCFMCMHSNPNVSCFKPFKTILKNERDAMTTRSNHIKPNKITLIGWVNKVLN